MIGLTHCRGSRESSFIVCLLVVMLASAACASLRRQPPPPDAQVEVPVSRAAVWAGVVDALMMHDLPLLTYNEGNGHAVAETRRIDSTYVDYADCGRSGAAGRLPTRALVETWIVPDSSRSRLRVRASYYAITSAQTGRESPCRSTGVLEQRVAEHTAEHANSWRARRSGGRGPPPE
jgi:hypothetical protein